MKEYLLYIRIYDIFAKDYVLKIRRVKTDNIYRVIGKIYCTTLEQIQRIDYVINSKEHEDFWKEQNIPIFTYIEPKLSEEKNK